MLALTDEYIAKLNATTSGGIFIKTVEFVEDYTGPVMRYFVDHTESIVFNGNTYLPAKMVWENLKTSHGMTIDAATISVANLGGLVGKYIKEIDLSDNDVTMRLLHLDLLSQLTGHWSRRGFILSVGASVSVVTFTVGRRLGRNVLPRKVFTQVEFPGLPSEVPRILG